MMTGLSIVEKHYKCKWSADDGCGSSYHGDAMSLDVIGCDE